MSPHKQDPASREVDFEVEIDLSKILVRRDEVERAEVQSGNAPLDWTDWSLDVGDTGISLFGLANISFFLGSCLIGLICALSSPDTSNIRGEGHIDRMTLSVRGRNLIQHDHNVSVWNLLPGPSQVAYSKQSPTLSTIAPLGEEQSPALSPSVSGVADRASTNASRPLRSDIGAPEQGSRTTASSAENVRSKEQTTSEQSSRSALTRSARKRKITSRTNVSNSWQNFQRSLARGLHKLGAGNSTSRTTRQTGYRLGARSRSKRTEVNRRS
jgi:hypothetical protein